jgi:hypothetical protein
MTKMVSNKTLGRNGEILKFKTYDDATAIKPSSGDYTRK